VSVPHAKATGALPSGVLHQAERVRFAGHVLYRCHVAMAQLLRTKSASLILYENTDIHGSLFHVV
jgi:hypothetical protein